MLIAYIIIEASKFQAYLKRIKKILLTLICLRLDLFDPDKSYSKLGILT